MEIRIQAGSARFSSTYTRKSESRLAEELDSLGVHCMSNKQYSCTHNRRGRKMLQ